MSDPGKTSGRAEAPPAKRDLDAARPHGAFADTIGYYLEDWRDGEAVVAVAIDRHHLNRSGIMHGGVLTTLIDVACGYAGCYCDVPDHARRAMTVQLNALFVGPAREGDLLRATGRCSEAGGTLFFATCEVTNQDGEVIGRGDGVFKYRRGSADPGGVPVDEA